MPKFAMKFFESWIDKGGREVRWGWKKQEEGINCGREFVASLKYPPLSRTGDESHAGRSIVKCGYSNLLRCC